MQIDVSVNLEMAQNVTCILMQHPQIQVVELFGSVAKEGEGNDLDMILVSYNYIAQEFFDSVNSELNSSAGKKGVEIRPGLNFKQMGMAYQFPHIRYDAAILSLGWHTCFEEARNEINPAELDLLVFPLDWKERCPELQKALPHADPQFMQNLARDAILIS